MASGQDVPPVPHSAPMLTPQGVLTPIWAAWFRQVFTRVGGHTAPTNIQLAQTTLPTSPPTGLALTTGSEYFDTATKTVMVYDGSAWRSVGISEISVKAYGAIGDGVHDDTAAIQAAATAAASFITIPTHGGGKNATLYFPPGNYLISNTVTIKSNVSGRDALITSTYNGVALQLGDGSTYLWDVLMFLPNVSYANKLSVGWSGSAVGVKIYNAYNSEIHFGHVYGFTKGIYVSSIGGVGNVYNNYFLSELENNQVQLYLRPGDATSWVNQNNFFGGYFHFDSAELQSPNTSTTGQPGCIQVFIDFYPDAGANECNQNVFYGCSLEGNVQEWSWKLVAASVNYMNNCRWESAHPKVYFSQYSSSKASLKNQITLGYRADNIVVTEDANCSQNNLLTPQTSYQFSAPGTQGQFVYANISSSSDPIFIGLPAGSQMYAFNPVTDYAFAIAANQSVYKRTGDVGARMKFDHVNGRIYFSDGSTASPTGYLGAYGTAGIITSGYQVGIGTTPFGQLRVATEDVTVPTLVLSAITSQSSLILQVRDASNTLVSYMDTGGNFFCQQGNILDDLNVTGKVHANNEILVLNGIIHNDAAGTSSGMVRGDSSKDGDLSISGGTGFSNSGAVRCFGQNHAMNPNQVFIYKNGAILAKFGGPTLDLNVNGSIGGNSLVLGAALAITYGGTGQTTKLLGFNALSPMSVKGDVVTFDGTNNVRFGVGTDGFIMSADSTQTTGLKWIAQNHFSGDIDFTSGSGTTNGIVRTDSGLDGEIAISGGTGPANSGAIKLFGHSHATNPDQVIVYKNGTAQATFGGSTYALNVNGALAANSMVLGAGLPIASGGSGQTTAQAAMDAFAGALTSGSYLRGNGTHVVMSAIQAADVPTLNQNTTGTAQAPGAGSAHGNVTLDSSGNFATVAPGAASGYLRSNGTDWVRSTIQAADVPTLNQNTTGTAQAPGMGTAHGAVTLDGSGSFQSVAPGTAGNFMRSNGTDFVAAVPTALDITSPTTRHSLMDDFIFIGIAGDSLFGDTAWVSSISGTGAANAQVAATAGHPGIVQISTGTTTTGSALLKKGFSSYILGGGAQNVDILLQLPTLSNGTDTYSLVAGLANDNNIPAHSGIMFQYQPTYTFTCTGTTINGQTGVTGLTGPTGVIDLVSIQATMAITGTGIQANTTVSSVNAGAGTLVLSQTATASGTVTLTFTVGNYWMVVCSRASAFSFQVTNQLAVAATWTHLQLAINSAGTSVTPSVGGVAQEAMTTNLPIAAMGPNLFILKSAGTTAVTAQVDYWYQDYAFASAR